MTVQHATLEQLQTTHRGAIITPDDPRYDEGRRVWNAMIDRRPAVIVRCRSAADVMSAVNYGRDNALPIAVRGGAHGIAGMGTCNDGLVIDFADMKGIRVDRRAQTVRAEPGLRWTEFDRETQAFGLATTGGTIGDTGIAGLTLGGGFGWLEGRFGMTVDNVVGADLVLATGELVHASAEENSDLFWAIRGGGGNFGVVTSFEYRLHQVGPMIVGGLVIHPFSAATDLLRFYRDLLRDAPDELTPAAVLLTLPDGNKGCAIAVAYSGAVADGERIVQSIKSFGRPVMDAMGPIPYLGQQSMLEQAMPPNLRNYWKADFVATMSDEVIETAVNGYAQAVVAAVIDSVFPNSRSRGTGAEGCDGVSTPRRDSHGHLLALERPGSGRTERPVGPARLGRRSAAHSGWCLRERARGGRGERPRASGLRRQLHPAGTDQSQVRSEEPVPPQREHRTGLKGDSPFSAGHPHAAVLTNVDDGSVESVGADFVLGVGHLQGRPKLEAVDSNIGGIERSEIRRIPSVFGLELTLSIIESSQRPLHALVAILDKRNRLGTSSGARELDEPPSLGQVHVDRPLRAPHPVVFR